ncbi:MAG: hypothetical protein ACHRXM_20445 [Isosphaerales bacterium]
MSSETPISYSSSCLIQVRPVPAGQFTAQLVGAADLQATAATREEAIEQLRGLLQEQVNLGLLLAIELPRENPLMRWFGHAKDDPTFDDYLNEIRKFREEVDRREGQDSDPGECPDTSLTPTT